MNEFLLALPNVLPILFLITLGYLLKINKYLSKTTITELRKFLLNISLPCLMFLAFLNLNFEMKYAAVIIIVFLAKLLVLVINKKLTSNILNIKNPYFPIISTGFAAGIIGIPLFEIVYGVENISKYGIVQLGHEIYVWGILFPLLLGLKNKSGNIKKSLKSFIKSPIMISIILGFGLNMLGYRDFLFNNPLLKSVMNTLELASKITSPLILITIGYQLVFKFEKLYLPLKTVAIRLIFLVPLALIINKFIFNQLLNLDPIFNIALLIMFILPPPFIISLFIPKGQKENQMYVDNTISLSIVTTLIIFVPLALFLN